MINDIIILLRPKQWIKNLLVFAPAFFSGHIFDESALWRSAIGFVIFCVVASSVYCLNDAIDYKSDQQHHKKCRRPVAAQRISPPQAVALSVILMSISIGLPLLIFDGGEMAFVVGLYLAMNIGYCYGLKNIAIVDILIIAIGYILRLWVGGLAAHVLLSQWIVIITFMAALLLAMGKRRDDLLLNSDRKSLDGYSLQFVDISVGALSGVVVLGYFLYAISVPVTRAVSENFYLSGIIVAAIVLRYCQVVLVKKESGNPTELFYTDRFLQCALGLLVLAFLYFLYWWVWSKFGLLILMAL